MFYPKKLAGRIFQTFTPLCVDVICLVRRRGGGDFVVVALMDGGVVGCIGEGWGPQVVLDLAEVSLVLARLFPVFNLFRLFCHRTNDSITNNNIVEELCDLEVLAGGRWTWSSQSFHPL